MFCVGLDPNAEIIETKIIRNTVLELFLKLYYETNALNPLTVW